MTDNSSKFNFNNNQGSIGSVGDNNLVNAAINTFHDPLESIDLLKLANDLSKLLEAMKKECKETEHYVSIGEIDKAQKAAKLKDFSKVKEHLKSAGKWSLDIASKIGVNIAAEALKSSMGI